MKTGKNKILIYFFALHFSSIIAINSYSQQLKIHNSNFLQKLFTAKEGVLKNVVNKSNNYRLQIIYTRITRNTTGKINFKHLALRHRPDEYFYPASIVKLPLSIIACEKINSFNIKDLTINSPLQIDSSYYCQTAENKLTLGKDFVLNISDYIKKALVVSNNNAYNRLFEFAGIEYLYRKLQDAGYINARITHRFNDCSPDENRHTNEFKFFNDTALIYTQAAAYCTLEFKPPLANMKLGKKHKINDAIINAPRDFSAANCFPLEYIHKVMIDLFFPEYNASKNKLQLNEKDRNFIIKNLCAKPGDVIGDNQKNEATLHDTFFNYIFYGADKEENINPDIQIYNIVGQSYGFSIDCAYIKNEKENIDFFLSAVIYTNSKEIINSNEYEYTSIAMPFMKELGKTIYNYEKSRKNL